MKKLSCVALCFIATSLHSSSYEKLYNAFQEKVAYLASRIIDSNDIKIQKAYAARYDVQKATTNMNLARHDECGVEQCIFSFGFKKSEGLQAFESITLMSDNLSAVVSRSKNVLFSWKNGDALHKAASDVAQEEALARDVVNYLKKHKDLLCVWHVMPILQQASDIDAHRDQDVLLFLKSYYPKHVSHYKEPFTEGCYEVLYKTKVLLKDIQCLKSFLAKEIAKIQYPDTYASVLHGIGQLELIIERIMQTREYTSEFFHSENEKRRRFRGIKKMYKSEK